MKPSIKQIVDKVSELTRIDQKTLMSGSRFKFHCAARHAAYLIAREQNYSTPRIGAQMGGRDHSTVLYGSRKALYDATRDPDVADLLAKLREVFPPLKDAEAPVKEQPMPRKVATVRHIPAPVLPQAFVENSHVANMINGSRRLHAAMMRFYAERKAA